MEEVEVRDTAEVETEELEPVEDDLPEFALMVDVPR
jgi:hypothetical protein